MVEEAVPSQWRTAVITPIPKVPKPTHTADYRLISITPVLSRSLEKYIVRTFIYPALQLPYPDLCFDDQFNNCRGHSSATHCTHDRAVRPRLLETLMNRVAQLNIPHNIYSTFLSLYEICRGMLDGCSGESQCYIQGSGLGPASFIVTAADLHPTTPGNRVFKFADDTYLWYRRQTQVLDSVKYPM